jgi:recombination protein RecT
MQQPELMAHDARLVFREVARIAALGLRLEKDLGEAYMVVAYNYKSKKQEPQARIGYRGMIKLSKQSGTYTKVYAREVHQNDQYDVLQGTREELIHRPVLHGDPGEVIEYYAVAQLTDGTAEFDRMTVEEVIAIRDRSDAWKAFCDGKIKSTPWQTDFGEMAKKTVIRRLAKRLDQSPELTEAIKIEDEAEFPSMRDITPAPSAKRPPAAPKPALLAPSPKVGQRSPKKPPSPRTGKAYKEGGKEPAAEAEEHDAVYSEEESAAQLAALRDELDAPLNQDELVEIADRWRSSVQHQFLPKHQKVAEAALRMRGLDVFEGDGGPTFFPEDQGGE